ncbi:DUF4333 domain-containing protein [Streptomyces sp. WI04-05B]|uniref:DUF4333 domain-containing protein n=1 Tax=Streptomyces TaxID=1883 RepID=UPI0029B0D8C5|nr:MULTISPECIES: DUF4333 domain-containing protein [unclassified Streptomyces]MDX2548122.1 DUF4333 domain-containing protein [Streptomyces sp. WI04-05B]MDX2583202.1 DUF4333 domain-containing protein [Streptomyces sp. WI04-05A]
MKYLAASLATATALAMGGLAFVAVPRLLSTESTSTANSTGTVSRPEVEKQVRDNYSLPLFQEKPKSVSCAGGLNARQRDSVECTVTSADGKRQQIMVSVTRADGDRISYDYAVLER